MTDLERARLLVALWEILHSGELAATFSEAEFTVVTLGIKRSIVAVCAPDGQRTSITKVSE